MNIYFAGAIRSGRQKVNDYIQIVKKLQEYGEVLTTHVANPKLDNNGEYKMSLEEIYTSDINWLAKSDLVIAEVSIPSLGIGYELAFAEKLGKKVICLYDNNSNTSLSAMIGGNSNFSIVKYNSLEEILNYLDNKNLYN